MPSPASRAARRSRTGEQLRPRAQSTPRTRLTLEATVDKVTSSQLVGILPGDGSTDELIVVNTHTDGMNAFEENGGIGMVWLFGSYSRPPRAPPPTRTPVF